MMALTVSYGDFSNLQFGVKNFVSVIEDFYTSCNIGLLKFNR